MSNVRIKSKDIEEYVTENCDEMIDKIINQMRKMKDSENEPIDKKHVRCSICGGRYNKSVRCVHDKTQKHQKALGSIKDITLSYLKKT